MSTSSKHLCAAIGALLAFSSLAACGSPRPANPAAPQTPSSDTATFPAPRGDLTITKEFGRVHIRHDTSRTIVVQRRLTKVGLKTSKPDWTLKGNTLDLGTGCGSGFVGLCEPSYEIVIPKGTRVHLKDTSEQG